MFSRSHFIKKRRIISQWTCSCLLIFFIIFSTLLCTSCFHHSSNNANNVFGSLCYLKKLFFSYSPQVMHILCCNLDHLTISLPSFVAKKLFILIERSSTNFRIFFAHKIYEWNKCVCGYLLCAMMMCLLVWLLGWFYACKTYLHASSPDNHTLDRRYEPATSACANETYTYQLSGCTKLHWISFCSNISSHSIHKFLAHKFLMLLMLHW